MVVPKKPKDLRLTKGIGALERGSLGLELLRRRRAAGCHIHGVLPGPLGCQHRLREGGKGHISLEFTTSQRQRIVRRWPRNRHVSAQENQREAKKPAKSSEEPAPTPAPVVEVDIPWEVLFLIRRSRCFRTGTAHAMLALLRLGQYPLECACL